MKRVAIVGVGQTRYEESKGEIFYDMAFEAARRALDDAGLERGDLDSVVTAGYDLACGRTISNMYTTPAAGGYLKDETRVSDDGIYAAAQAYMRILAGFDITMVLAYGLSSEAPLELISNLTLDPLFHRDFGLYDVTANALQVSRYLYKYRIKEEQGAKVVIKNRVNALDNPYAHRRSKKGIEDVLKSRLVAWPLRELMLPPRSDGACAVIMAPEEIARRITDTPVWIEGVGWCNDTYYLGDKELSGISSLKLAAKRAYRMAGITDPIKDLDVIEFMESTCFHELMGYESLGLCREGEAGRLIDEGITGMDGEIPVNPSGGALSADPLAATGLIRVAEAAIQVMGKAGKRQVLNVKRALAHGCVGLAGQGNCVIILGG